MVRVRFSGRLYRLTSFTFTRLSHIRVRIPNRHTNRDEMRLRDSEASLSKGLRSFEKNGVLLYQLCERRDLECVLLMRMVLDNFRWNALYWSLSISRNEQPLHQNLLSVMSIGRINFTVVTNGHDGKQAAFISSSEDLVRAACFRGSLTGEFVW